MRFDKWEKQEVFIFISLILSSIFFLAGLFTYKPTATDISIKKIMNFFSPSTSFIPSPTPIVEELLASKILDLVNKERAEIGLVNLEKNDLLEQGALMKAEHLCENDYWAHESPDGVTPWDFFDDVNYRYTTAGENLAKDFWTSSPLVSAWMDSKKHKENIINNKFFYTGVAVYDCNDLNGRKTKIVVQLFGSVQPTSNNKTNINSVKLDPNTPVHCPKSERCGGGTIPLKQWECDESICCEKRDGSWVFYKGRQNCFEDQKNGV